MNQRIALPAFVIGGLFALALTFLQTLLPAGGGAGPESAMLNLVMMLAALLVYGTLMRKAFIASAQALSAPAPATTAAPEARTGSGRSAKRQTPSADGQRAKRGDQRSERKNTPRNKPDADAEAAPAAPSGPREEGHIKWFSGTKGYGFVIREDGSEIFMHHRALRDRTRRDIPDGQPVTFVAVTRDKGPQADDVEVKGQVAAESAA